MKRSTFLKTLGGLSLTGLFGFKPSSKIHKNPVIEFTPEILKKNNFGLYLINDKADVEKNPDYAATVSWKLSWNLQVMVNSIRGRVTNKYEWPKYGIVNFLTDGWYYPIGEKYEDICNYLNNSDEKFRIMTKEELIYIIENRSNSKQLFYNL